MQTGRAERKTVVGDPAAQTGSAQIRRSALFRIVGRSGLLGVLVLLCVLAAVVSPTFLQVANLINVLRQMALYGIVSIGMTFVILTAGIDLSVGSTVGIVAIVITQILNGTALPPWLALVIGVIVGGLVGTVNGLGIALGRIPAFIMTLGIMVMGRGLAMTLANGEPISLSDSAAAAIGWIGSGFLLGVPVPVWIFASIALLASLTLRYAPYGRYVYAAGSNEEASRLSGIPVFGVKASVYIVSGVLAAVTAIVFVARLSVAEPTAGTGLELEAIAITVIGGASLFGGEGTISGTILGAAILAVLANILNLAGVTPFTQQIVKGAIIIAAVLVEIVKQRRK
jgi:ribose/xylose/arabinose/galactoside ABC-type transport system permease subunit